MCVCECVRESVSNASLNRLKDFSFQQLKLCPQAPAHSEGVLLKLARLAASKNNLCSPPLRDTRTRSENNRLSVGAARWEDVLSVSPVLLPDHGRHLIHISCIRLLLSTTTDDTICIHY